MCCKPEEEPPWSSLEATVSDSAMATPNLLHSEMPIRLLQHDPWLPRLLLRPDPVMGGRGRVGRAAEMVTVQSAPVSVEPANWPLIQSRRGQCSGRLTMKNS